MNGSCGLSVMALLAAAPEAAPKVNPDDDDAVVVVGHVIDEAGAPVTGATVVAAPADDTAISVTSSDAGGRFSLLLPHRKHLFGAFAPGVAMVGFERRGPLDVLLTVKPDGAALPQPDPSPLVVVSPVSETPGRAPAIQGQAMDEAGRPLSGVRVDLVSAATRRLSAHAFSIAGGTFAADVAPGAYRLVAVAPGLHVKSWETSRGLQSIRLILGVDARAEQVTVRVPAAKRPPVPPKRSRALIRFQGGSVWDWPLSVCTKGSADEPPIPVLRVLGPYPQLYHPLDFDDAELIRNPRPKTPPAFLSPCPRELKNAPAKPEKDR